LKKISKALFIDCPKAGKEILREECKKCTERLEGRCKIGE
jgi:hypothetical protein